MATGTEVFFKQGQARSAFSRARQAQDAPRISIHAPVMVPSTFRSTRHFSFLQGHSTHLTYCYSIIMLAVLGLLATPAQAVFLNFQNCIDQDILHSNPRLLQFIPYNFSAAIDLSNPNYTLNVTAWGNVTGIETQQPYPAPDDPQWSNPNDTVGKIVDLSQSNNKYTTLITGFDVLSYTPYSAATRFCLSSIHGSCPLGPAFYVNETDLENLPAFSVSHGLGSSYAFTSITTTMSVRSGDASNQELACITATITPDLGGTLRSTLRYVPLVILISVGFATVFAAIWSPWGSTDIFRWTSNYGRDEDLLRLVTPGFGDCLQYIQFILLTGSLTLNYPGFYQPAVSEVGWSSLMFNESLVTGGNGTQSVVDGLYSIRSNGTYGLDQMSQLIGMTSVRDIWAGMIVWLVVIIAAVVVLTQLGFALRWVLRQMGHTPAEDLRSKNWPFTGGNVIRIVFNYFMLPLVSLSMFQLVIAGQGPTYSVAIAVILLVAVIASGARVLVLFSKIRPRSFLFDDLPTVLLWGPLYNTYCDDQAGFAFLPILLNFVRGIAIGAVQPSGIAQIIMLAICEIIFALALNAIRPFPSATSMNIYHTFFCIIRLVTILLSVAFVPSLGVSDATSGWIGYIILLLHAAALVFGFFLNAIQTVVEVAARLAGAGGRNSVGTGATRGGLTRVFGMRQLSKRIPRHDTESRHSMASGAVLLSPDIDSKSLHLEASRVRSMSGSSTLLLNGHGSEPRSSRVLSGTMTNAGYMDASPNMHDTASTYSRPLDQRNSGAVSPEAGGIMGIKPSGVMDPYYRKPRRATLDLFSSPGRKRNSFTSEDQAKRRSEPLNVERIPQVDVGEGSSISRKATPVPAHLGAHKEDVEEGSNELTRTKTDYAVREVDYYYGVRGPALSSGTRKLKTGPADPTGPVSSATGWFKGVFGGKIKEKGKGFEVVRSSRAPPQGTATSHGRSGTVQESVNETEEVTYHDDDDASRGLSNGPQSEQPNAGGMSEASEIEDRTVSPYSEEDFRHSRVSPEPPLLPALDTGGGIELPSRLNSHTSQASRIPQAPAIPVKSLRGTSSQDAMDLRNARASIASQQALQFKGKENRKRDSYWPAPPAADVPVDRRSTPTASGRLPFTSTPANAAKSNRMSTGAESITSSVRMDLDSENKAPNYTYHEQNSSSALGVHAPDVHLDRPSSVGFVQQHRASDHIHQSPESPEHAGSIAEFIGSRF